ncbi:Protein of unknown function, partial [Gryllus bimaculatus]
MENDLGYSGGTPREKRSWNKKLSIHPQRIVEEEPSADDRLEDVAERLARVEEAVQHLTHDRARLLDVQARVARLEKA